MKKSSARKKKEQDIKKTVLALIIIAIGIAIYVTVQSSLVKPPPSKIVESANKTGIPKELLVDNLTIRIKENDFYAYPLTLYQNQTVAVFISTEDTINTLFMASSQFEQYKNLTLPSFRSVKYFVDASFWGVRNADFRFTAPESDSYHLLIGKKALIEEQPSIEGNATVRLLVYEIN